VVRIFRIGEIGLQLGEIAEPESVVVIFPDGECGVNSVVVLAVKGIVEPDSAFHDRTGESEERDELIETPSVLVLDGRDEVGGVEAEVIVADAGVEAEKAGGPFAGFGRFARGLDLNGAEGVSTDADEELSVRGLSDVEPIEYGLGLIGLGTRDVRLTVLILDDARDEVDGIAVVMRGREDHVHDIETGQSFLGGNLRGIDGLWGFVNVDGFAYFLHARDGNVQNGARGNLNVCLLEGIETLFFDAKKIGACGNIG